MTEPKLRLSTTKIGNFLGCRKRYYWTYERKLVPVIKSRPLQVGSVVHDLAEKFRLGEITMDTFSHLDEYVHQLFPNNTQQESVSIAIEAGKLAQMYIMKYENDPYKVISPEMHLELERDEYILYTRLDSMFRGPNERLWRGEIKTTARMDSAYLSGLKGSLQSGIAYLVMKEVIPEPVFGTVYDLIVKKKEPECHRMPIPAEKRLLANTEETIAGVVRDIKRADFYPSMQCFTYNRECDYYHLCYRYSERVVEEFYTEYIPFYETKKEEGGIKAEQVYKKLELSK